MTKPVRLQLTRAKGFSLQALSVATNGLSARHVARPSRFGNPFTAEGCRAAGYGGTDAELAARCVEAFRGWLTTPHWRDFWDSPTSEERRKEMHAFLPRLRGKNLACWCKPGTPCHADVLLDLANPATDP